jgi:hypothetical protein
VLSNEKSAPDLGSATGDPDVWALGYKVEEKLHSGVHKQKKTPWSESASELYRPSDRRLSVK